jgi:hypothetical protein
VSVEFTAFLDRMVNPADLMRVAATVLAEILGRPVEMHEVPPRSKQFVEAAGPDRVVEAWLTIDRDDDAAWVRLSDHGAPFLVVESSKTCLSTITSMAVVLGASREFGSSVDWNEYFPEDYQALVSPNVIIGAMRISASRDGLHEATQRALDNTRHPCRPWR